MLHPVGPLPASVYWRRRILAIAAGLVALLILWLVTGSGSGDPGSGRAAGSTGGTASTAPASPTDPASSSGVPSETLAATPPAVDPGRRGGEIETRSDSATPTGGGSGGGSGTGTQGAAPVACSDAALRLTVSVAKPDYPVGAQPQIALSLQNTSGTTCTRDLAASQQEVLLYDGRTRLWSSNDCYPGGGTDVQAIASGERDRYSVTWSGLASRPGCAGTRTRVGAGRYSLVGRIGTLRSEPTTLILR
ncbi:MAG: hypothetical protein V7637_2994 [Mycobacteriales bacterium]